MKKSFHTTVSVKDGTSRSVLKGIVQHDTLNEVNIRLTDGSRPFDYTGYTNIILRVRKADGTSYVDSEGNDVIAANPSGGLIAVILKGQATAAVGLCQCVIEIYADGEKMTSARLNYEVTDSLGTGEDAASESQYPAFQKLLSDLSKIETDATAAGGYATRAEIAAAKAEMWAKASQDVSEGDFATRAELDAVKAGAAPSGFGLGGAARLLTAKDDLNNVTSNGWYMYSAGAGLPKNIPTAGDATYFGAYGLVHVMAYRVPDCVVQIIYNMANVKYDNVSIMRTIDGTVGEWEWVNPPMLLGVEYRTTERYMGKPVYAKLVDFGALPNASAKIIEYSADKSCRLISASGNVAATGAIIPSALGADTKQQVFVGGNGNEVWVVTYQDYTNTTAYIRVKYIKSTD